MRHYLYCEAIPSICCNLSLAVSYYFLYRKRNKLPCRTRRLTLQASSTPNQNVSCILYVTYFKVPSPALTKGPKKAGVPSEIRTGHIQLRVTVDPPRSVVPSYKFPNSFFFSYWSQNTGGDHCFRKSVNEKGLISFPIHAHSNVLYFNQANARYTVQGISCH